MDVTVISGEVFALAHGRVDQTAVTVLLVSATNPGAPSCATEAVTDIIVNDELTFVPLDSEIQISFC